MTAHRRAAVIAVGVVIGVGALAHTGQHEPRHEGPPPPAYNKIVPAPYVTPTVGAGYVGN